jgi:hypothetical protein
MHSRFRWVLGFALAMVVSGAARAEADPFVDALYNKPGFAGLIVRPAVCMDRCDGTLATFGLEGGYKMIGFAFRYGYKDKTHNFFPDLRFYWDFQLGRNLVITPQFEFTPQFGVAPNSTKTFQIVLRPGVRVGYAPAPYMMLFVEPFMMDLGVYTKVSRPGISVTSGELVLRYNFGAGIQTRF